MKTILTVARHELLRGRWPFALAILFVLLPFGAGPSGAQEGSALRQVVLVTLFLAATFAIVRFPERWTLLRQGIPVTYLLLLIYVALSVIWSPEPWVSFKRLIQVAGVAVLGLGLLVGGNGHSRVHRVVAPVLLFAMLLAIVFTALYPNFAFAENGLRAFMATKNNFGQLAALCVLFPLVHVALGGRYSLLWFVLAACGLAALVLSRSATTGLAFLGVVVFYAGAWALLRVHRSWWPAIAGTCLVGLAVGFVLGLLYGFPTAQEMFEFSLMPTGRDVTLAGRTYLWELILAEGMRHPWFGVGYGGFWLGPEGASGQVAYQVKWGYPGQAHNGYLDLFNELGVVGCLLVLALVVQHARNVGRLIRMDHRLGLFHAAMLLMMLLLNLAEAALLRTTHAWWIIFSASVFEVAYLTRNVDSSAAEAAPRLGGARVPAG